MCTFVCMFVCSLCVCVCVCVAVCSLWVCAKVRVKLGVFCGAKVRVKLGGFCGVKVRVKLGVLQLLSAAGASFRAKRVVAQLLWQFFHTPEGVVLNIKVI